jgi:hypothetical protein
MKNETSLISLFFVGKLQVFFLKFATYFCTKTWHNRTFFHHFLFIFSKVALFLFFLFTLRRILICIDLKIINVKK